MNYPTETLTSGNEQQAITSTKASTNTQNPASNNQLENQDITKTPFHINTIATLFAPSLPRKKSKSLTNSTTSPTNYKDASQILHR
ncbi:hypothetical protein ACXDKY_005496 [Klebsiella pneumoniae]